MGLSPEQKRGAAVRFYYWPYLYSSEQHEKWPQFRESSSQTGLEKVFRFAPQASLGAFFSEGLVGSPVSKTPSGECNAITNR
jgi:hypothetical protein